MRLFELCSQAPPQKKQKGASQLVTRSQKEETVAQLKEKAINASVAFVADFNHLTVADLTDLRKALKGKGKCVVVKNTLAERALSESEFKEVQQFLVGPSLLVLGQDDASQTIKSFIEFQKKLKTKLVLKGGVLAGDKNPLNAKSLEAIGELPPKEIILAQIAGYLVSTPTSIAQGINQIIGGIGELAVKVAEKQNN